MLFLTLQTGHFLNRSGFEFELIQLFRERLLEKKRDNPRKAIWNMMNTLFLALSLSNLLLLFSFSIRKHTSMASRAILSNFFEKK